MSDLADKYKKAWLLIVDDNAANVALLEKMLKRAGYENVESTTDSRQARDMFVARNHDLILLDIRMPHLDGYDVMQQLSELTEDDFLPVLVLTAQTDMETRLKALEAGARDFLNKPVDQAEALNRIRNLLEVRLLNKEIRGQNARLEDIVAERTEDLRRAMEMAEQSNTAKSEFLSIISHELRTPLNAIIGFSDIIEKQMFGEIEERYRDYSGEINVSARQLLELINNILDVTNAMSGQTDLDETDVDVGPALQQVQAGLDRELSEKDIQLAVILDDDLPRLHCDSDLISRACRNLLSNCIKFSNDGGKVEIAVAKAAGGGMTFSFRDEGSGIAADELPRIIVPFGQSDTALSRSTEGAGIGLTLAISFIELHDGELQIDSEPGVGTTVNVKFPGSRCNLA